MLGLQNLQDYPISVRMIHLDQEFLLQYVHFLNRFQIHPQHFKEWLKSREILGLYSYQKIWCILSYFSKNYIYNLLKWSFISRWVPVWVSNYKSLHRNYEFYHPSSYFGWDSVLQITSLLDRKRCLMHHCLRYDHYMYEVANEAVRWWWCRRATLGEPLMNGGYSARCNEIETHFRISSSSFRI